MSFFGKIDFNELSEVDRSIYHYMSSNSDKIPYMRVREIANESHTSSSSVMRLIRKLGYESFTEFRTQFKTENEEENEFSSGSELLNRKNFPRDIESRLVQVAEKIVLAENIVFFGMGASGSICDYAARRLAMVGYNSFALVDPTYPVLSKLRNTSDNVLITLSVSGATTEVVELVNGFRNAADFTTVAITSDVNSTLGKMSHFVLDYRVGVRRLHKHADFSSQIPCIYLIESLINEVEKLT